MATLDRRLSGLLTSEKGRRFVKHPLKTVRERRVGPVQGTLRLTQRVKKGVFRGSPYVLVAAMPRTGSTFLTTALAEATTFKKLPLNSTYGRSEQDLYLPKILDSYSYGTITQQHLRATQANLELMSYFSIRPVLLVRNIFDIVISIRDYLRTEGCENWPTFYCDDNLRNLSETGQLDAIIDLGLPWYFSFYVSWFEATRDGQLPALWMTYEEARTDWSAALLRILQFYGIDASREQVESALQTVRNRDAKSVRLNKGLVGRGEGFLTDAQKEKICGLGAHYPQVDFARIGIPHAPSQRALPTRP